MTMRPIDLKPHDYTSAHALPAAMYTDPEYLQSDIDKVLLKNWQLVGHVSQVAEQGDCIVETLLDKPILVIRNNQDQIKAFYNVCRHRAGPVAQQSGNYKSLRCAYHGWNYDLDGQLKSAPEMRTTENFDVCEHKLPELRVALWFGFIFVGFAQQMPELASELEGIDEIIQPIDLKPMQFSHRQEYLIDCNWKVYMDNYLEGYHLPLVHPGLSKLLDYRTYQTQLFERYSYQFSPLDKAEGDVNFYGDGQAHYFCVFPNLMLNILPNRVQTNQIIPVSHNKTRVIFDTFYSDLESEHTKKLIEQDKEFSDEIQVEDVDICEAVQRGLQSGSYQSGPLCAARESGVVHYQNLIREAYSQE